MKKGRRMRLCALMLAGLLTLSACTGRQQNPAADAVPALPEPQDAARRQILGENFESGSQEVTLYLPETENFEFTTVTRAIHIGAGENLLEDILAELLNSNEENALLGSMGVQLNGIEFSAGIATVRLSVDASVNRSDQEYLLFCASIANTLLELDDVEAVNILSGERSNAICNLPSGVFTAGNENIAAAYAQLLAESERFEEELTSSFVRDALIYFPAQGGQYLLPEVRRLNFDSGNFAQTLISALMAGPQTRKCCFSPIPGDDGLLLSQPDLVVNALGERVLYLDFSAMLPSYLALAGVELWQCYGALVLTLCSFLPELDAVHISVDGMPVNRCDTVRRELYFQDALMRRSDFSDCIGGSAQMYFAQNSNLVRLECATAQSSARTPYGILTEMISAGDAYLPGLSSIFPEGIAAEDILGTATEGRVTLVNLSANFYARCQSMNEQQERLLIYGMVNALTELEQTGAVSFLVEGRYVESLSQSIYLKTSLLPDPGLVGIYNPPQSELSP